MSDDEDRDDDDEDFDGEDNDDGEDNGDEDDEHRVEHDYSFDEETEGIIVAGKAFDVSGLCRRDIGAFAAHVDAIAEKQGISVKVVPAGDFTDTGPGPDDEVYSVVHVGILGPRGGTYSPDGISREAALRALESAHGLSPDVWTTIGEKLTGSDRERYDEAEIGLHFTCVGPLAAATLAFGVSGNEDGEGPGEYLHGQDMEQEPHTTGVWGKKIAYVQYEGPESEPLDLTDTAHKAHIEELGNSDAQYYIIARYD